jgi:Bin/amphiphysin/Rvs domain for vesicular trafficking
VKEQLGTAEEKTQLPDDYLELEKRVDALKQVHQKLLSVTYVYTSKNVARRRTPVILIRCAI